MGKSLPETCWADLGDHKTVIVASCWFSILLYLHWWCTVEHKSSSMWSVWDLSLSVVSNISPCFSVPSPLPDIKGATGRTIGTAAHVAESQGWENKYFKWKIVIFCQQEILNYWAMEKGNSINSCDYLKVDNLCKGWSLWLLAPSIKEPGHATLVLPRLTPFVLLVLSHLCHGTAVSIFVRASIFWLFWDFRIFQDEGTIFLWNVGIR
jgi:hypothetical protein